MQNACENHNPRQKNIACLIERKEKTKRGDALYTKRQVRGLFYCTEGDLPFFIFYLKNFW
ncbi:Hypothetical Protein U712_10950 [Bacillus subtilis PY79]|nr:Hypothetical Protein U712_10950 [Bacillus subtilis PY79]